MAHIPEKRVFIITFVLAFVVFLLLALKYLIFFFILLGFIYIVEMTLNQTSLLVPLKMSLVSSTVFFLEER